MQQKMARNGPNIAFECIVPSIALLFPENRIPSGLAGLTAEFGMGSGVTLPLETLGTMHSKRVYHRRKEHERHYDDHYDQEQSRDESQILAVFLPHDFPLIGFRSDHTTECRSFQGTTTIRLSFFQLVTLSCQPKPHVVKHRARSKPRVKCSAPCSVKRMMFDSLVSLGSTHHWACT